MSKDEALRDLIERVERAEGPAFALDCAIGQALRPDRDSWPAYSASIDAALTLAPRGWIVALRRYFNSDGEYVSAVWLTDSSTVGRGCEPDEELTVSSRIVEQREGDDPTPRAIVAASLRAHMGTGG